MHIIKAAYIQLLLRLFQPPSPTLPPNIPPYSHHQLYHTTTTAATTPSPQFHPRRGVSVCLSDLHLIWNHGDFNKDNRMTPSKHTSYYLYHHTRVLHSTLVSMVCVCVCMWIFHSPSAASELMWIMINRH